MKSRSFLLSFPLTLMALFPIFLPSTALAQLTASASLLGQTNPVNLGISAAEEASKWGLFDFFMLLGSLALLLYGMQRMSEGLQQAAGKKLRHLMGSMTSNPVKGMFAGLGITVLIQSSSVTTVMAVSFVNAGILTLQQAASVLLGANIGTTLTAWIVDTFGFKVSIAPYTLIIIARSEEHTSELQSRGHLVCRLLL